MKCRNCGKEIVDGVLVCGYCGHAVPQDDLSPETKDRIEQEKTSDESLKQTVGASARALGITLTILSGICGPTSHGLIGTGTLETFNIMTIASTAAFMIGLILTFAFR